MGRGEELTGIRMGGMASLYNILPSHIVTLHFKHTLRLLMKLHLTIKYLPSYATLCAIWPLIETSLSQWEFVDIKFMCGIIYHPPSYLWLVLQVLLSAFPSIEEERHSWPYTNFLLWKLQADESNG